MLHPVDELERHWCVIII